MRGARRPKGRPEVASAPSGGGARRALRGDVTPRPNGDPEVAAATSAESAVGVHRGGGVARATVAGLIALAALEVLWESALAPLRPGSAWLALKALPLVLLVPGVARGRRRPRQILSLLLPLYAAEALVRAITEPGRHAVVAAVALALAVATFCALLAWFRAEGRRSR